MNAPFNQGVIAKEVQFERATQGIMRAALLWSLRQLHADGLQAFRRDLGAGLPPDLAALMASIADDLDAYAQARTKAGRLNQDPWAAMMTEVAGRDAAELSAALLWEFVPDDLSRWKRK
jgi:hypothetical protein